MVLLSTMVVGRTVVLFILNSILFASICSAAESVAEKCELNMNGDLPKHNQPLILNKEGNSYSLLIPKIDGRNGVLKIDKGDNIKIVCPGDNNSLRDFKTTSIDSQCERDKQFASKNKNSTFNLKDALCVLPPKPKLKNMKLNCSTSANLYEIGFEAEGWQPLISLCHDVQSADTFYTKHIAIGAALKGAERESFRPRFEVGSDKELYKGFNPNDFYLQKSQNRYFANIFKNGKHKDYIGNDNYLSRGHLSPDGDFLFASWQFATYLYPNAAPQWQKVNSGNWLTVEKFVKEDLIVTTGTNGILELSDANGKKQKLHLNQDKIRVPEYFWKVIHNPKTSRGIGIVTSNNPFLPKNTTLNVCKDVCAEYKWLDQNSTVEFKNTTQGLTICCSVDELRQIFPEVPPIEVNEILAGPHVENNVPKRKYRRKRHLVDVGSDSLIHNFFS